MLNQMILKQFQILFVEIDHGSFTVVTGVSGSGKSSLVFETLFAEGQRRYVESLSSYARQFLGRMKKPLVDDIQGLCPAVAIEQKVNTRNPRSTVATSTEIYDYIKLLFSRVGHTISPISGREVKRETSEDVLQYCQTHKVGERALIMAIQPEKTRSTADWDLLIQKGFSRIWCENQLFSVQTLLDEQVSLDQAVYLVVDRLLIQPVIFLVRQCENMHFREISLGEFGNAIEFLTRLRRRIQQHQNILRIHPLCLSIQVNHR